MEKKLGEIEKRSQASVIEVSLQSAAASVIEVETSDTPLLTKRHSVFRRQNIPQPIIADKDERSNHSREIGKKVARDFGNAGVFIEEVVEVDCDSEDIEKVEPVYVVQYTDGDREDMDHDELQYAYEFHLACLGVDVDNESCSGGSNDEESYQPSPKVCPFYLPPHPYTN
jgi:hypothetical protein